MTETTQEFLAECKKAGYERIAIFIKDERVPASMLYSPKYQRKSTQSPLGVVVSADPPRKGPHPGYKTKDRYPAIWGIVKRLSLNPSGAGFDQNHHIADSLTILLTPGYYDLSELN